jgi:hypothetical protein
MSRSPSSRPDWIAAANATNPQKNRDFWRIQAAFSKLRAGEDEWQERDPLAIEPPAARRTSSRPPKPNVQPGGRPAWMGPETSQSVTQAAQPPATIAVPAEPSCFHLLGIDGEAGPDEVKRRFRELAKVHHPDRGGKHEDFVAISGAYVSALRILLAK